MQNGLQLPVLKWRKLESWNSVASLLVGEIVAAFEVLASG
jgi:hypothetical protein